MKKTQTITKNTLSATSGKHDAKNMGSENTWSPCLGTRNIGTRNIGSRNIGSRRGTNKLSFNLNLNLSLILGLSLSLATGVAGAVFPFGAEAQAQTSRPPVAPPTKLPPIPGKIPHLPPANIPLPSQDFQNPNAPAELQPAPEVVEAPKPVPQGFSAASFYQSLLTEAERFNKALDDMKTVVLSTDQPRFAQERAMGKFTPERTVIDPELGLMTFFAPQSAMNTLQPATCYIAMDTDMARDVYERMQLPLEGKTHPQTLFAFSVGHAVGHCLDRMQREKFLRARLLWNANDAVPAGIWPQAVMNVYGGRFAKDAYLTNPQKLDRDPLQNQFEERAASAFATAWAMKMGATPEAVDMLSKYDPSLMEATQLMRAQTREIQRMERVDLLWDLTRLVQRKVGVSSQTLADASGMGEPYASRKSNKEEEIVRYAVTPQGVVRVNDKGQPVPDNSYKVPTSGQSFGSIPRFGRPNISGN